MSLDRETIHRAAMLSRLKSHFSDQEEAIEAEAETINMANVQIEAYLMLVTRARHPIHFWSAANLVNRTPPAKLGECCRQLCT